MEDIKKSGFTLIELLGILVLIAIIGLISFVAIDKSLKSGKENAYEKQIKLIELAAKNWASDNLDKLPDKGKFITVNFMTLKMYGYLDVKVSDPITGLCFPNDAFVTITHLDATDQILYEVNRDSLNNGQLSCNEYSNEMLEEPYVDIIQMEQGTLVTGQELTLIVVHNYETLNKDKIHLEEEIYEGEGEKSTINVSEISNYDGTLYNTTVTITAGSHKKADVWIEIAQGAVTLADGRESSFIASRKIRIDNSIISNSLAQCNNFCALMGSQCTNDFLRTDTGVSCQVNLSKNDSGEITLTGPFHILKDDGVNLTMIADYNIANSYWNTGSNSSGGSNDPWNDGPVNAWSILYSYELTYNALPIFSDPLYERVEYVVKDYKLKTDVTMRLPRYQDFYDLSYEDNDILPTWLSTDTNDSYNDSYWLSSVYNHTVSSDIYSYYNVCIIGNTIESMCGWFYDGETQRGIRPVIVIPKERIGLS